MTTTRHMGFRVTASHPDHGSKTDTFELRQSAIECARMCEATCWTHIRCDEVLEEWCDGYYIETSRELQPVKWREVTA